jgi:hypothetical protein
MCEVSDIITTYYVTCVENRCVFTLYILFPMHKFCARTLVLNSYRVVATTDRYLRPSQASPPAVTEPQIQASANQRSHMPPGHQSRIY